MLSEEMGESFSDGQHHQTVLLEISSSPNDELADMAKQEEALEGMVSSLGDEQEQLQRGVKARQKKLLAKKNAQLLAAKAVHDQAKERKGKQQKSQVYDSKLLAREARLRMTTSAEVAAEAHLAAALEEKRRHDRERQKQTSVQPVTQLTAEQQTREEYKRMYVQNLKQQAVQVQVDLHNKLRRVRDSDEQHLQEALLTIKDKKNALLHEISEANSLRESLEEDQELGESMENTQPAKTVKKMVAAGHQIADVERETIAQARVLRSQLQDLQGYNNGVAKLAHDQLKTYDMSVTNNADAKLLAAAGSGSMKLRLQLDKLAQLNKHAAKIEKAVGAMQSLVETASSAQTVAQNKLDHVSLQLDRMQQHVKHQESGYTLKKSFKKAPEAELGETQESTTKVSFQAPLVDKTVRHQNIGESSRADPKSKMPIQAQMDWEQQMLIGARSQVEQIKLDTPKLLQKQQEVDNKELTKVLQAAKGDLAQVAHRFEDTAGSISSTIKDGQTLGEAIRDEQDSADGYQRDLVFLKRQVALADTDAQKASNAISMALSQINSLVK